MKMLYIIMLLVLSTVMSINTYAEFTPQAPQMPPPIPRPIICSPMPGGSTICR